MELYSELLSRKVKSVRKEGCIQEILAERGDHPGLVHIFSAMESCTSYKSWHDKKTHRNFLNYRGFNLLAPEDQKLFQVIARGEHFIGGMTNKSLRQVYREKSSSQISRLLKRLRMHGLIKKSWSLL